MKIVKLIVTTLVALVFLLAACSPQAPAATAPTIAAPTMAPAPTPTPAAISAAANVMVAKNDSLGSFLANNKGMTLYILTKDSPNNPTCYDKCAAAWPPLLSNGAPVAGDGIDASKLGTAPRKDGSTQVTYNGWPLYYFAKDANPGDTNGQGVGSVWYVLSPAGVQITK